MRTAAIIPARGGSKRVPRKNLARVGGLTLIERAVMSAAPCEAVYVSTDDDEIGRVAQRAGAIVTPRPAHLATDKASTEQVVEHWWRTLPREDRPDVIVLLQPTSPLREAHHVAEALAYLGRTEASSVVSVEVDGKLHFTGRLYPREDGRDFRPHRPIGHRPRTQETHALGLENGAIWCFTRDHWERHRLREGGQRFMAYEGMDKLDSVDIDSPRDVLLAEACLLARDVLAYMTDEERARFMREALALTEAARASTVREGA